MRFQDYLNEKITRKEFDTVLNKNEVNCGCEFEFYLDSGEHGINPDQERLIEMVNKADKEALKVERVINNYETALDDAQSEINELKEKRDDLQDEPELEDKIEEIDDEIVRLDLYIGEGAWEEYEADFPHTNTMPNYSDILEWFKSEFGMDQLYRNENYNYDNFNELAFSWIEDREVPPIEQHLGFTIEDFFEDLDDQGGEISEEDLMQEGFPVDLYIEPGWEVEPDSSLGASGVEVITPILKINELLDTIDEVFDWIDDNGYTDNTCGFHVHMSLDPNKYELDPLKLIMFIEEGKIYEHFQQRIGNRYAQSINQGHLSKMAPFTVEELKKVARKEKLDKNLNTEKMLGLHLIELQKNHVEYRYMGAKDYQKGFKAVRNNIVNYAYWLSIACDPDFKKKEYIKKLQRMVDGYNRVLMDDIVNEFRDRVEKDFKTHEKMTGISHSKYKKLVDRFILKRFVSMLSIPKPSKDMYNIISKSTKKVVNKKVQELKKEFTDKVKRAAK